MTTGPNAVRRILAKTGEPLRVAGVAKVLRQQVPPLFTRAVQGGSDDKSQHCEPPELINLAIAFAVAEPVPGAPAAVATFRSLILSDHHVIETNSSDTRRKSKTTSEPVTRGTLEPLLHRFGQTLGERLDGLVTELQKHQNQALRKLFRASDFSIRLVASPTSEAEISLTMSDSGSKRREVSFYRLPQSTLDIANEAPPAALRREVVIPFTLIDVLIDIWGDTIDYRVRSTGKSKISSTRAARSL